MYHDSSLGKIFSGHAYIHDVLYLAPRQLHLVQTPGKHSPYTRSKARVAIALADAQAMGRTRP